MIERQSIVIVALKGRCTSKPRPWVVVQDNDFNGTDSVLICALSHSLIPDAPLLRIDIEPSTTNGLHERSQVEVEKLTVVRRADVSRTIGRLEDTVMRRGAARRAGPVRPAPHASRAGRLAVS